MGLDKFMVLIILYSPLQKENDMSKNGGAGRKKTGKKLEPFKLFAPKGCNKEVFAIYMSVIGGVIKGFTNDHPNYKEDPQLLTGSLLKRICVSLVAVDVTERIKDATKKKERNVIL